MSGKGDTPRPVDGPTYRANFERALGPGARARQAACGHVPGRPVTEGDQHGSGAGSGWFRVTRCVECGKELARVALEPDTISWGRAR